MYIHQILLIITCYNFLYSALLNGSSLSSIAYATKDNQIYQATPAPRSSLFENNLNTSRVEETEVTSIQKFAITSIGRHNFEHLVHSRFRPFCVWFLLWKKKPHWWPVWLGHQPQHQSCQKCFNQTGLWDLYYKNGHNSVFTFSWAENRTLDTLISTFRELVYDCFLP